MQSFGGELSNVYEGLGVVIDPVTYLVSDVPGHVGGSKKRCS